MIRRPRPYCSAKSSTWIRRRSWPGCSPIANFAFIKRKIDAETAERVRELNLRGIYFRKEPKRFYPKRELAAQVLGYVGMDDEGLGGLEREFDDDLRGIPGQELISIDARRKWFSTVEKPPDPGQNLVLTIDQTIQYIAEKELIKGWRTRRRSQERSWWKIRAPAKSWRWRTGPPSIPTSLTPSPPRH